jgi:hypothetical protein
MPPVREASTKPIAATVLPAPWRARTRSACARWGPRRPLRDVLVDVVGCLVELLEGRWLGDILLLGLALVLLEVHDEVRVEVELADGLLVGIGLVVHRQHQRGPAVVGVGRARAVLGRSQQRGQRAGEARRPGGG